MKLIFIMLMMIVFGSVVWLVVVYVVNFCYDGCFCFFLVFVVVLFGLNLVYLVILSFIKMCRRWIDFCWSKGKLLLEKGMREKDVGYGVGYLEGDIGDFGILFR